MTEAFDIELADGASSELALAIRSAVERTLAQHPERADSFRKLHSAVLIRADDGDAAVTLDFKEGGRLRIYDGEVAAAHIRILGDGASIEALTRVGLRAGVPALWTEPGRLLLRRQLGGELTIRGLVLRLPQVRHLLRVLAA